MAKSKIDQAEMERIFGNMGLAQIASDVVAFAQDSFDRPLERQLMAVEILKRKLEEWRDPTSAADQCIKMLVKCALVHAGKVEGGIVTKTFSQMVEDIAGFINSHPEYAMPLYQLFFPHRVIGQSDVEGRYEVVDTEGV